MNYGVCVTCDKEADSFTGEDVPQHYSCYQEMIKINFYPMSIKRNGKNKEVTYRVVNG